MEEMAACDGVRRILWQLRALAVGFLVIAAVRPSSISFLMLCAVVLAVNALVGVVGCYLHLMTDMHVPAKSVKDTFLYGAPVLAPLLFPSLALLGNGQWPVAVETNGTTSQDNDRTHVLTDVRASDHRLIDRLQSENTCLREQVDRLTQVLAMQTQELPKPATERIAKAVEISAPASSRS